MKPEAQQLEQLERDGYTIFPNFLEKHLASRVRAHMDSLLPTPTSREQSDAQRVHVLRHPIPGTIMAEILNNPRLLELAQLLLAAKELRLLEQVLIRTDPSGESILRASVDENTGAGNGIRATGWHIDMAFLSSHYNARPRQTYFHMVHALNTVEPGGGGTAIVPGSHHKTFAAAERLGTKGGLSALQADPIGVAEIDLASAVEVHPREGDLLVFNPMCLHSASTNVSDKPRYVYFASFFDTSAIYLQESLQSVNYNKGFPDSLRDNLPAELHSLLAAR